MIECTPLEWIEDKRNGNFFSKKGEFYLVNATFDDKAVWIVRYEDWDGPDLGSMQPTLEKAKILAQRIRDAFDGCDENSKD